MDSPNREATFVADLMAVQDRLHAYALALLGDLAAADDIVQQTNLILWCKADEFEPGSEFGAWACRVAFYEILKHRQRLGREKLLFDDDLLSLMAEHAERHSESAAARHDALRRCLRRLTSAQRELLDRRYASGRSVQQIADELGRSVGSISQTLYRLRASLTECIRRNLSAEADS